MKKSLWEVEGWGRYFFLLLMFVAGAVVTLWLHNHVLAEDVREADLSPRSWKWGGIDCREFVVDGHSVLIFRSVDGVSAIHNPGCKCQKPRGE